MRFVKYSVVSSFLLVGLLAGTLSAQSITLSSFTLESDGADVLLSWDMPTVEGVSEFRLFRRLNEETTSTHVATLSCDGSQTMYSYLDDGMFKQDGRVVHYELQVVMHSNKVYSFSQSLSHNPTSVQRTWGSIKAMFRD